MGLLGDRERRRRRYEYRPDRGLWRQYVRRADGELMVFDGGGRGPSGPLKLWAAVALFGVLGTLLSLAALAATVAGIVDLAQGTHSAWIPVVVGLLMATLFGYSALVLLPRWCRSTRTWWLAEREAYPVREAYLHETPEERSRRWLR